MLHIALVPIHFSGQHALLPALAEAVERAFRLPVRQREAWFDMESCFDPGRTQYNSTQVLRKLLEGAGEDCSRVLGVTGVDLFIPVLTFVFGEAQLGGRAAVVSTFRLRSEAYGLQPDPELLLARLTREVLHELGHTYGLVHCTDSACVMASTTYVEQIDLKGPNFCTGCLTELHGG